MHIYGLDFTSSPTRRKPITCACCELYDTVLIVKSCRKMTSFDDFETFLGATRLFNSPISILPCRPTFDNRIAVEGFLRL